ncbi:MAG: hypothetical protein U1A25_02005 [Candidatus Sungbacteria bacterium]|nr:hypothetical protein [Candidatus Sungbacteria bacterium]
MGEVFAHDAVESCPFEPNHADSSERERLVFRDHLDQWYLKILDNKYPFLGDRRVPVFDAYGPWNEMDAVGNHEIIIDTPDHYLVLHEFDVFGISEILRAAGERYLARKVDRSNFFFYLFRNNGRHAGASISHSHWQLFFSNFIPSGFEEMHHEYEQYKKWTNGGCLKCAQSAEVQKGVGQESSLLVSMNGHCTAFVPFAPEYPYEIWIVPDVCSPCFAYDIKNPYLRNDIAHMLREVLKRFAAVVGKPSLMQYNIMLYTGLMLQDTNPSWHWYLRFTPRCFEIGGACEHGIKMFIVPGMPEMYAQTLREIM